MGYIGQKERSEMGTKAKGKAIYVKEISTGC